MKALKIIGIILVAIAALVFITIQFLPSTSHMERSIMVDAPATRIYQDLIVFKNYNEWSPWAKKDPNAQFIFSGPDYGVGAKMEWVSEQDDVGNGSMEIVNASYQQGVTYEMAFDGYGGRPLAELRLTQMENGTEITWTYDEKDLSGISKIFGAMMDSFLGPDYEQGLIDFKARMESMPSADYDMEITITTPYNYLSLKDTINATMELMGPKMGQAYGQLMGYAGANGMEMAGPPMAVYTGMDENGFSFITGIPVGDVTINDDLFMIRSTHDGMAMRVTYMGAYETIEPAYNQLYEMMEFLNLEAAGNPWEEYVSDPTTEPDTANWVTYIYQPIL